MTSQSREAIFCIGSNCGCREANVDEALKWLSEILMDFRHSNIYATPDCHGSQRVYLNAVGAGKTTCNPHELERFCKEFEVSHGRVAEARNAGDVPVDVDLVIYDDMVLRKRDYDSEFFQIGYRMI